MMGRSVKLIDALSIYTKINATAKVQNGVFRLVASNLYKQPDVQNPQEVILKVDTGAVDTVIYPGCFDMKYRDLTDLSYIGKLYPATCKSFVTASNDKMTGYRVCAQDVKISGILIKRFVYYIVAVSGRTIGLLGNDFIRNCSFFHEDAGKPFCIHDLNYASYSSEFQDVACIPGEKIVPLLNECLSHQIIQETRNRDDAYIRNVVSNPTDYFTNK